MILSMCASFIALIGLFSLTLFPIHFLARIWSNPIFIASLEGCVATVSTFSFSLENCAVGSNKTIYHQ